jgi:hypothetical protein
MLKENAMKKENWLAIKNRAIAVAVFTMILFAGCQDPLTKMVKDNGYAPLRQISDGYHIGDIYKGDIKGLSREVNIKKNCPDIYLAIQEQIGECNVVLPAYSGSAKFEINANAYAIGEVAGQLKAYGATQFNVKVNRPSGHEISNWAFRKVMYPMIRKGENDPNYYVGMYVITNLLKADGIEYKLMNKAGGEISVKPSEGIPGVFDASVGGKWDVSENSTLSTTSPCYIGYKLGRITSTGGYESVDKGLGDRGIDKKFPGRANVSSVVIGVKEISMDKFREAKTKLGN